MATKNNYVLCISPTFAPMADSEAFCGAKMILSLMDQQVSLKVFTLHDQSSIESSCDRSPLWKRLDESVVNNIAVPSIGTIQSAIFAIKYRILTWGGWIDSVIKCAIQSHRERPFDIVYSRSLPMIAHVAGYWISRKLKIPWVANINDPWDWHLFPEKVSIERTLPKRIFSNYWLKKTFQEADLLTFPNKRLHLYHEKFASSSRPTEIIPHVGYSSKRMYVDYRRTEFNLVHAGKLGLNEATGRSAASLLKGLRLFIIAHPEAREMTKLILVGPRDDATEELINSLGIAHNIISTGRLSYEESIQYIESATVCVLIEGKMAEGIYLPSKFVDYIAARKPVLALSPAVGIIADMLPCKWLLRVNLDDEAGVASSIGIFYEDFKNGTLNVRMPPDSVVRQYDSSRVAEKFLSALSAN